MAQYQALTANGYNLFHVSSALQKCIRRGLEQESMFWAFELLNSNYEKYLWKRLTTIVTEDIGLAEPMAMATFAGIRSNFEWWVKNYRKGEQDDGMPAYLTSHAVLLLVRAKKSRVIDDAYFYHEEMWKQVKAGVLEKPEIPDFAFDMHTIEGKKKGRANTHFFDVSAQIHPHDKTVEGTEFYETEARKLGTFADTHKGKMPSQLGEWSEDEEADKPVRIRDRIRKRNINQVELPL